MGIPQTANRTLVLIHYVFLVLCIHCSMTGLLFAQDGQLNRPRQWIGYTECRNDLPDGQYVNWLTKRACLVRADGTHRREIGGQLIRDQHSWTQFGGWSPDGEKAIVLSAWESPENAAWERAHKTFRMTEGWLMDTYVWNLESNQLINVTAVDRISAYNTASFTANGRKLLMTSLIEGVSKPFVMDLDGRNKRDISAGGTQFAYGLSCSPDGRFVAYHENYQIYVSNLDGTRKRLIETGNPFNFAPQWSPNSQRLLFLSGQHYDCHPHIAQTDGSQLRKLGDRGGYRGVVEALKHPDFHSESSDVPVWAHDGQSIFYTAQIGGSIELMQCDLNGNQVQLTHSRPGTRHYHPAISTDGNWISFGSDRNGTMQLYVTPVMGGETWPITDVPEGYCAMHAHWQPISSCQSGQLENRNSDEESVESSNEKPIISTVAASTPEFPRKSEGDVIELLDGRLLMVYMEFSGDGSDFAKTRLVAKESPDGGLNWLDHRVITETLRGDMNVYSPNLIRSLDGSILLVFMRQHGHNSRTCYAWKSTDEGKTFSAFSEFFPNQEFSLCNATLKRLESGRLLLPSSPPVAGQSTATGPYCAVVLYSDDDGRSWQASESLITLPMRGAMEPHVEQVGDGSVLMVIRNQLGKVHFCKSIDDGKTWNLPWASDLQTPESCPELVRLPDSDDLLLIWNNTFDARFRSHYGKRSPLTAALSSDHGRSWKCLRNIETDPTRAFSNPGCRFTKSGKAIINYWTCQYLPDWRMQDSIDLRVAIVDQSWFTDQAH